MVAGGVTVLMDGLQLSGNVSSNDPALRVSGTGSRAWLDRSRIVQNTGGGIVADGDAEVTARNCFVGDGTNNGSHGFEIGSSSAHLVSSTVGAGFGNFEDVFPIYCSGSVEMTFRNSFLVSFDGPSEISCPAATVANTALIPGNGNVALGDVGINWFVELETGNFHLDTPPQMLATTALWTAGDPPTDIDGDPRPAVDGIPDYAGPDVP